MSFFNKEPIKVYNFSKKKSNKIIPVKNKKKIKKNSFQTKNVSLAGKRIDIKKQNKINEKKIGISQDKPKIHKRTVREKVTTLILRLHKKRTWKLFYYLIYLGVFHRVVITSIKSLNDTRITSVKPYSGKIILRLYQELCYSKQSGLWHYCQFLERNRLYDDLLIAVNNYIERYGVHNRAVKLMFLRTLVNVLDYASMRSVVKTTEFSEDELNDSGFMNIIQPFLEKKVPSDIKICVWGFTGDYYKIVNEYKKYVKCFTFSTDIDSDILLNDVLFWHSFVTVFDSYNFAGNIKPRSKQYPEEFIHFCNLNSRYTYETTNFDFGIRDFVEMDHKFDLYYFFFEKLFENNNINQIIICNIPHQGADYIFYLVAKHKNLNINILYQSIFPNHYFIMNRIEDLGKITSEKVDLNEKQHQIIDEMSKPTIVNFATRVTKKKWSESNKIFFPHPKPRTTIFGFENNGFLNNHLVYAPYREILKLSAELQGWRFSTLPLIVSATLRFKKLTKLVAYKQPPLNVYWRTKKIQFLANSSQIESNNFSLDEDFIYFPMHYQPELTTSALGDKFYNQIDALELLSELCPDYQIFVKENPKQEDYMRPDEHYMRIKRLKNVIVVPINTSTRDLIQNSKLVATISGTAGFEALTLKKPTLIFGNAWYKEAPNVLHIDEALNTETVEKFIESGGPTTEELKKYLKALLSSMHLGVIGKPYDDIVENFHMENNAKIVANNILDVLVD